VLKRSPNRSVYEEKMGMQLSQLQVKRQMLVQRLQQQVQQKQQQLAAPPPPIVDDGEVEFIQPKSLEEVLREKSAAAEAKGEMIDVLDSDDEAEGNAPATMGTGTGNAGSLQQPRPPMQAPALSSTAFDL
jgi:hypothetical protein